MKRVLLLGNSDIVIYNFRLELVERLLKEGYEVWISCPYGERIESLLALGCKYENVDISRHGTNPIKELTLLRYYYKFLQRIKPDIVLTYTIKPNIYGGIVCSWLHIPYITNITGLGTAVENKGAMQKITLTLYKYALAHAQKVFFQNTENQAFFVKNKIAMGKHDLLPGSGVNLERFSVMEYPPDDTVEFAFISRIMKEKGIDQYLEAAQYIKAKYPHTVFHVCGFCEEDYTGLLERLSQEGIIVYHGMVKDVREILKGVHCTVHPTYYPEGLSNTLLESCACGRPIITTDRSGCREVVADGINGYIVQEKDNKDLVLQIEKFLDLSNSRKKEMGLVARLKVEKEFDREIVVNQYLEEVRSIQNQYQLL